MRVHTYDCVVCMTEQNCKIGRFYSMLVEICQLPLLTQLNKREKLFIRCTNTSLVLKLCLPVALIIDSEWNEHFLFSTSG